MHPTRLAVAAAALAFCLPAFAQSDLGTPRVVVDRTVSKLKELYVFPDMGTKVEAALKKTPRSDKQFASANEARQFAEQLTGELQTVTKDKHLRVGFSETPLPQRSVGTLTPEEEVQQRERFERLNFGVERVERLRGNIGYIELRAFAPLQWAGDKIASAMNLVGNTDALIVDLRGNGGGDPSTVAFMTSYLFDTRTHLNSFHFREGDRIEQFHTFEWVPGKRFGEKKPVFVLTSSSTFSGAEEFSYNLKNLKRATLVGETTGGGANPGDMYPLNAHFQMFVPIGRAVNPITKTNWEGTGVAPDVPAPADKALSVARAMALKTLVAAEKEPDRKAQLQRLLDEDAAAAPK